MSATEITMSDVMTVRGSDDVAIEQAIAATYPWARALARLLTRNATEAEDLVQESMLQAFRRPPAPPTPETLQAWLRVVMPRLHVRRLRRAAKEARVVLRLGHERPAAERADTETTALLSILAALPPKRRACTVMFYVLDMSESQIAGALGMREGTVKAHLAQARAALRTLLTEEGKWAR